MGLKDQGGGEHVLLLSIDHSVWVSQSAWWSVIETVDLGDLSRGVFFVIEVSICDVVFLSVLEFVGLRRSGGLIKIENLSEDGDLFLQISLFLVKLISLGLEVLLSDFQVVLQLILLGLAGDFLLVFLGGFDFKLSDDCLLLGHLVIEYLDLAFQLEFVISSGWARVHLVFLTLAHLLSDRVFEVSEDV